VNQPAGFHEIQRQEMSRLFGLFTRARLALIPTLIAFYAWVVWTDPVRWRVVVLAVAVPVLIAVFVFEFRRWRKRGLSLHAIDRNLAVAVFGVLVIATVSGGLESPFLLVALMVTLAVGLFASPAVATWLMLFEISVVWTFAVLALTRGDAFLRLAPLDGGRTPEPSRVLTVAVVFTLLMISGRYVGRVIRRTFDAMLRRTVRAQAESLRAHAERAEELTALSAEIAHELKNPLASVKGLAGLLAGAVSDPKGAERLGVLRREVDRMQIILDEFLNFSRPLVPLALGQHDVGALCREVASLHEGMAEERGVTVEADGAEVRARCDPRKVKQVLINLVQNALDAAPHGSAVVLSATADGRGGATIEVEDRGPGLDAELAGRVFEPGVTTKASGSGLGLTIARALARQHGGDLALRPRAGGGTSARLTLPGEPAPAAGGGAPGCGAAA
jgi:signal transduction histidine kinase